MGTLLEYPFLKVNNFLLGVRGCWRFAVSAAAMDTLRIAEGRAGRSGGLSLWTPYHASARL
jgi:hypothetical protein